MGALPWKAQLEIVHALWRHPEVGRELQPVLKSGHFENPALGWVAKILMEQTNGAPLTEGQVMEHIEGLEPHMREACKSLLPDIRSADLPEPAWAVDRGRMYAAAQESVILAGELPRLAREGNFERIRARADEVCKLAVDVADRRSDLVVSTIGSVVSERVQWLWRGFLPVGHVTILDGDPGLGKSTLLADVAARVSTGGFLPPCGENPGFLGEPEDVVILSAEDSISETIRPRLEVAKADLSKIHALTAIKDRDDERSFEVMRDAERLDYLVAGVGARLVIVDPLVGYLGPADFHRDQDVRRVLRALGGLAARRRCSVVVVRHLNKDQSKSLIYRGGGSIGVIGAVRTGLLMAKHPTEKNELVVAVSKSNLAKIPQSIRFKLVDSEIPDVARVEWVGETGYTAAELLEAD